MRRCRAEGLQPDAGGFVALCCAQSLALDSSCQGSRLMSKEEWGSLGEAYALNIV